MRKGTAQSDAITISSMPRRRYRDDEDEENDVWEWIDDEVLSRVFADEGDQLEAIQALAEAQFLVERARAFSEKTRAGKLAAVIERQVLSLSDDASRSFIEAITACLDACKRAKVIPAKRVQLFERLLKQKLIARTRSAHARRRTEGLVSLQYFPEDILTEIITRCDAKTRSVLSCVAKAFRDANERVGALSHNDLSSHPRATCTRCHDYVWVRDIPRYQSACNGKKRAAHAWKSSIKTWRRDVLICVGIEDAESDAEDEDVAELIGKKFWKICVVDES